MIMGRTFFLNFIEELCETKPFAFCELKIRKDQQLPDQEKLLVNWRVDFPKKECIIKEILSTYLFMSKSISEWLSFHKWLLKAFFLFLSPLPQNESWWYLVKDHRQVLSSQPRPHFFCLALGVDLQVFATWDINFADVTFHVRIVVLVRGQARILPCHLLGCCCWVDVCNCELECVIS